MNTFSLTSVHHMQIRPRTHAHIYVPAHSGTLAVGLSHRPLQAYTKLVTIYAAQAIRRWWRWKTYTRIVSIKKNKDQQKLGNSADHTNSTKKIQHPQYLERHLMYRSIILRSYISMATGYIFRCPSIRKHVPPFGTAIEYRRDQWILVHPELAWRVVKHARL